jgi:hypothetical protein
MIFERIVFHTYPTLYSAIGIILISCSALYIVVGFNPSSEFFFNLTTDSDLLGIESKFDRKNKEDRGHTTTRR